MKKRSDLDYLHDLAAKIDSRLDDMYAVQIRQQASLEEHIFRTELLEKELKPIRKFVDMAKGVGAFIALLALFATIYAGVK